MVAEGAGEGFMRSVAGVERQAEDVGHAESENAGRLRQPPGAGIAHQRLAGCQREGAGEVGRRDAGAVGDGLQRGL